MSQSLQGHETILLVEDEPLVRTMVARILRNSGYHVLEAANGHEGLDIAEHQVADTIGLLLTDIVMPEMNGIELAQRLTVRYAQLPVMFMSGYADNMLAQYGQIPAGTTLMTKPFTPNVPVQHVRRYLDTHPVHN